MLELDAISVLLIKAVSRPIFSPCYSDADIRYGFRIDPEISIDEVHYETRCFFENDKMIGRLTVLKDGNAVVEPLPFILRVIAKCLKYKILNAKAR